MAATSEAMVMGVKAGLDPRIMLDVINAGSGRNTATEDKFRRVVLPRTFNLGFTAGLMRKDVEAVPFRKRKALGVPIAGDRSGRRGCSSSPATNSVPTRISPPSCSRSNNAPGSSARAALISGALLATVSDA